MKNTIDDEDDEELRARIAAGEEPYAENKRPDRLRTQPPPPRIRATVNLKKSREYFFHFLRNFVLISFNSRRLQSSI